MPSNVISTIVIASSVALASISQANDAEAWQAYLSSLKAPESIQAKSTKKKSNATRKAGKPGKTIPASPTPKEIKGKIKKPKPLAKKPSIEEISRHNQQTQLYAREQNTLQRDQAFAKIKTDLNLAKGEIEKERDRKVKSIESLLADKSDPEEHRNLISVKKKRFGWGGKSYKYDYADYELKYESSNPKVMRALPLVMTDLFKGGWDMDLSRASAKSTGNGSFTTYTIQQIRLKREK